MCIELCKLIKEAQGYNKQSMNELIKKFNPIIKKYSYYLRYEDAESDLTLALIESMHSINLNGFNSDADYALLSYIKKTIIYSFYKLSKIQNKFNDVNILYDEIETFHNNDDNILNFELDEIIKKLTPCQQSVIKYKYFIGYSDIETAKKMSISRQAVNRAKNRGLEKLRKEFNIHC